MEDNYALQVVTRALVDSYPTWTDEYGANVDQLAAIAVSALEQHHLLLTASPALESVGDSVPAGGG